MKLAIIGAGAAGLAAAHRLRHTRPDIQTAIYEKSRGVGGRAATRRAHGAVFDHGAQYIKEASPEIEQLLLQTLDHATLEDIPQPVWTFDHNGAITPGDPEHQDAHKWTYSDGLTRFAKELAKDQTIHGQTRIGRLQWQNGQFDLIDDQGRTLDRVDAVLLTPPAPQSRDLIEASALPNDVRAALVDELAKVTYRRNLTLTLGYAPILRDRPFYALVNTDKQHPISWLAYEHLKPNREMNGQHVLIAQMAPDWSVAHWDDELPLLTATIGELASDLLDEDLRDPAWSDRQGWRYAQPDSGCDFDVLNSALGGLYFAGDFTAGRGRVHSAIEQGWRVADQIDASTPQSSR